MAAACRLRASSRRATIAARLGHAIPFGVYDLGADEGFVSVGIDNNTALFAVAAIADWWTHLGQARYPDATTLTITAETRKAAIADLLTFSTEPTSGFEPLTPSLRVAPPAFSLSGAGLQD